MPDQKPRFNIEAQRERHEANIAREKKCIERLDESEEGWRSKTPAERAELLAKQQVRWGLAEIRYRLIDERRDGKVRHELTKQRRKGKDEVDGRLCYDIFTHIRGRTLRADGDAVDVDRATLAKKFRKHPGHVSRALRKLEDLGCLIRVERPGKSPLFYVDIPDSKRYLEQVIFVQYIEAEDQAREEAEEQAREEGIEGSDKA
jgi:hypothetical protein